MKCLDLRLGNPDFLSPYWADTASYDSTGHVTLAPDEGISYAKDSGHPTLKREILRIHSIVKNVSPDSCSLIVGAGATQLLGATLRSLAETSVKLASPYYFMFPDIIRGAGKTINDAAAIEIVVDPSNPLNERAPASNAKIKITDLSYNWPTFGNHFTAESEIMIFSMAKATGHCASRIGWAFVKNQDLARDILWQIEVGSGGVSYEAQIRAAKILKDQSDAMTAGDVTVFEFGRKVLDNRWDLLRSKNKSKLVLKNSSGMFAWCSYPDRGQGAASAFLEDFDVLTVPGPRCGGLNEELRINMGCSQQDFDDFIKRISS